MEQLSDIGTIPVNKEGIRNIFLSTTFDLDTTDSRFYYHSWYIIMNIQFITGELSEDIPFSWHDIHFAFALKSIFEFLRDNGYHIGDEHVTNLEAYQSNILPHLIAPGNHLLDGNDLRDYNHSQMDYLRSCCTIESQNHLVYIIQNDGEVWDDAEQYSHLITT